MKHIFDFVPPRVITGEVSTKHTKHIKDKQCCACLSVCLSPRLNCLLPSKVPRSTGTVVVVALFSYFTSKQNFFHFDLEPKSTPNQLGIHPTSDRTRSDRTGPDRIRKTEKAKDSLELLLKVFPDVCQVLNICMQSAHDG